MARKRWRGILVLLALVAVLGGIPASLAQAPEDAERPAPRTSTEARGEAYAHLMRSMFAARRGEFRTAATEIRRAIKLQPESPAVYIEGASLLRSMGRVSEAEQLARQALDVAPAYADALRFLAEQAADRALAAKPDSKSLEEALALYARLDAAEPLDEQSLRRQANLRMLAGDLEGAIESTRRLSAKRPGDADVARMLYRLHVHNRQETEALRILLRYVARHPGEESLIEETDRLAQQLEAWDVVAEELGPQSDLRDAPALAHALLGEALVRLDRTGEAAVALEKALAAGATNRRVRLRLVLAYQTLGRLASAADLARGLSQENPEDSLMQLVLAQTLDRQRDVEGALISYGEALRVLDQEQTQEADGWRDRDGIRRRMADLYLGMAQPAQARRVLAGLERPDEPEAAKLLAMISLSEQDWEGVRELARRLRAGGMNGDAALLEGEVLARGGKLSRAEIRLTEAIAELGPGARWNVAQLHHELGNDVRAEQILREWTAEFPDDPNAHFSLGRFLYQLERFDEAEVALSRTFELNPDHAPALNFLGYSLAERNERLDEALVLIQRALAIDGDDGAYLDSLGWVYYQMERYDLAREPLERAAREFPTDTVIREHLGDLYSRLGEYERAISEWTRALRHGPEDPEALRVKLERARARPTPADKAQAEGQAPVAPPRNR